MSAKGHARHHAAVAQPTGHATPKVPSLFVLWILCAAPNTDAVRWSLQHLAQRMWVAAGGAPGREQQAAGYALSPGHVQRLMDPVVAWLTYIWHAELEEG